ncbi:hypothetical protein [Methanoregula sp.]|uniref:hypothetical protein n=1 Tax=Methanoregula sp. TaxID=2052170 RepID=UPI003564F035
MKAYRAGIILLLFVALLVPATIAASITISSDQTDYYFGLNEIAEIALPVSNTYSDAVDGTLKFTTVEQLQSSGTVMTSTKNRVYTTTIPSGNSFLNISAGTSDVPKSVKIQVAFQYTNPSSTEVTLPEIIVHFVQNPSQSSSGQQKQVTSTSSAASSGFGTSSVQIVQQSVSVQQQAGRDSSSSQSLSSSQSALQNSQMSQDTAALKEQLQREAAEKEKNQQEFNERLAADPLLSQANETLAADGFTRQSMNANPTEGDTGTFSMLYQNAAGDKVNLQGTMSGGTVPFVTEQSAAAVNVTAPLIANATYQSFTGELAGNGYGRNQTLMNVTLSGATVNITYLSEKGSPAYVNATVDNGNVTQISLAMEQGKVNYLLIGSVVALAIILAICAWWVYRRLKGRTKILPPERLPPRPTPVPFDHRQEALRLLAEAEEAFHRHDYRDAYGLAGRATRIFLSYDLGDRRELTNAELGPVLAASKDAGQPDAIMVLLERCSDVEFAKGIPEAGEFSAMIRQIRAMVEKKR